MKRYERFYRYLDELLPGRRTYRRVESEPYMALVIERVDYCHPDEGNLLPAKSLCHYGEQNGDAMRDPEVVFTVDDDRREAIPRYFRNDYAGCEEFIHTDKRSPGLEDFCETWFRNLREQGFFEIDAEKSCTMRSDALA